MIKVDSEEIRIQKERDQLEQLIRDKRDKFQQNIEDLG